MHDVFIGIVNIASLITAIVALLTILEMKKQRKESYKPIIVLVSKYYKMKRYKIGKYNYHTQMNREYEHGFF